MEPRARAGHVEPVVLGAGRAAAGADVEHEHGGERIRLGVDPEPGHVEGAVERQGGEQGVVTFAAAVLELDCLLLQVDPHRALPVADAAACGHAAGELIEAVDRVGEAHVVAHGRRVPQAAAHGEREVDRGLVRVLRRDALGEPGRVEVVEGMKKRLAERRAEALVEPRAHGAHGRAALRHLGQRAGRDLGPEVAEVVLQRIGNEQTLVGEVHRGTTRIGAQRHETLDVAEHERIAPEDPVAAADLEAIGVTVRRRRGEASVVARGARSRRSRSRRRASAASKTGTRTPRPAAKPVTPPPRMTPLIAQPPCRPGRGEASRRPRTPECASDQS